MAHYANLGCLRFPTDFPSLSIAHLITATTARTNHSATDSFPTRCPRRRAHSIIASRAKTTPKRLVEFMGVEFMSRLASKMYDFLTPSPDLCSMEKSRSKVTRAGLEPATYGLKVRCSTS